MHYIIFHTSVWLSITRRARGVVVGGANGGASSPQQQLLCQYN